MTGQREPESKYDRYAKGWEAALVYVRHLVVSCDGDMEAFSASLNQAIADSRKKYRGTTIYNKGA